MGTFFLPINSVDEPEAPQPANQHFSYEEFGLNGSRMWRMLFSWNVAGPPITLDGPFNLRMYYSDDYGTATWTESDSAHRPQNIVSGTGCKDGDIIHIGYHVRIASNTWEMRLNTFDVTTGLWGTEIPGGPVNTDTSVKRSLYLVRRSGVSYILYNYVQGGIRKIGWIKNDGAWSATTEISAAEPGNRKCPNGAFLDGTLIHFWFKSGTATTVPTRLYHRTLNVLEVMGATQLIGQIAPSWGNPHINVGPAVVFDNKIIVPYPRDTGVVSTDPYNPGYEHVPAIFIGDPAGSDSPSWTSEDISTTLCDWGALGTDAWHSVVATVTPLLGPRLYVFWVTPQHIYVSLNCLMYAYKLPGGAWQGEAVFYQPTEPTNPYLDDWVHNPDVITLQYGGLFFVIVDQVNASFVQAIGNEYSESGSVTTGPIVTEFQCLTTRQKHADDVIDLPITWTGFLNGDVISTFNCTATGLTVGATSKTDTTTTARLSGGSTGTDYFARYKIVTQKGMTEYRTIKIEVRGCS